MLKSREEYYKELFKRMDKAQREGNIKEYYLISKDIIIKKTLKLMVNYGTLPATIRDNMDDLKSEGYLHLWDILINFKKVEVTITTIVEGEEVAKKVEYTFKACPANILFSTLANRLKSRLYIYLRSLQWSNFSNEVDSISLESALYDNDFNLLDRLESTASRAELDSIGLIESLKGSLSSGQYNYLKRWILEGRQPYKDKRTVDLLKERLTTKGYTSKDIINLKRLLYENYREKSILSDKLDKMGI